MIITFREPIFSEQVLLLLVGGGAELEHVGDEGQSPQEQPNEGSLHE